MGPRKVVKVTRRGSSSWRLATIISYGPAREPDIIASERIRLDEDKANYADSKDLYTADEHRREKAKFTSRENWNEYAYILMDIVNLVTKDNGTIKSFNVEERVLVSPVDWEIQEPAARI